MAADAFQQANSLFVDERFEDALRMYNKAIELDSNQAEYFVKRSACYHKLNHFKEALSDANRALELDNTNANALLRKGIAHFALKDYEAARDTFMKGNELAPSATFKSWLQKAETELAAAGPNTPPVTTGATSAASTSTRITSAPTTDMSTPSSEAKKVRYEWYQNATHVFVNVFAKNVKPADARINITDKRLDITIRLSDSSDYVLDIDPLCDTITPAESSFEILSTKIEVKLRKARPGHWASLEGTAAPEAVKVRAWDDASQVNKHAYPTSSRKKIDWEELSKEAGEDKLEGEAALTKLFQDIYKGASEEQRRAMVKSFVESGGTVLSTNWEEVSKAPVKGSPPKGMEMHSWAELEHGK